MRKSYAKVLSICITATMILSEPIAVFATELEPEYSVQEEQVNDFPENDETETDILEDDLEETPTEDEINEVEEENPPLTEDREEEGGETEGNQEDIKQESTEDISSDADVDFSAEIDQEDILQTVDPEQEQSEQEQLDQEQPERLETQLVIEEINEFVSTADGEWNIKDFGAGNGNDDTYAINQALAKVTPQSPVVRIPRGSYNVSSWLRVNQDNTRIVFEDGAELVASGTAAATNGGIFLIQGKNITIENLTLQKACTGIKVDSTSGGVRIEKGSIQASSEGTGILCESASNVVINSLNITGSKFGILINGGSGFEISGNTIENQSQGDIWIQKGASAIKIENNTIKTGKTAGIWLDGSSNVTISENSILENGNASSSSTYGVKLVSSNKVTLQNNRVTDNIKAGINVDQNSGEVRIVSNTIQNNGGIAVCAGNGSSVDVSDNIIKNNREHGVMLLKSYGTIKDNQIDGMNNAQSVRAEHYGIIVNSRNSADKNRVIEISNNTVTGMIGNGIQVTGDKARPGDEGAINVHVTGNKVSNVGDNGITVNYNSHNAVITSNTVDGAKVNGIDVQGGSKNCKVNNNIINNCGNMGISIGSASSGGSVEITGNQLKENKNVGIHVTHSSSTATISNNKVTSHPNNFSIAVVKGAKTAISSNTVILPTDYIGKKTSVYPYAIFVEDGTSTTNGAAKFNFQPKAVAKGDTKFTGTGTPGLTIILNVNGSEKSTKVDSKWNYSIASSAVKESDTYSISAKDSYGNMITYTNGNISVSVDETKVKAFVERMYTVALNRAADTKGCAYWVNQLVTGAKDGAIVAKGFVLSTEMENRKLNDDQYVTMLYQTFFDRAPSANDSGKAFWLNLLKNGVSRAYVFRGFCHSGEFTNICSKYGITRGTITLSENRDQNHDITMYVYRCYNRTLGRTPDVEGLNYWTGQILQKQRTASEVAANIVFSQEFKNKKLSDEEFVKVMYRMFFDREYNAPGTDPNGIKFWLDELKSGRRDRYKVFTGFVGSQEFKNVLKTFGL